MSVYNRLNKIQNSLLIPYTISSVFIAFAEILLQISRVLEPDISSVIISLAYLFEHLVAYVFCYFIVSVSANDKKGIKGFWSIVCLSVVDIIITDCEIVELFFAFAVLFSFLCVFCFKSFDEWLSFIFLIVFALLFGLLLLFVDKYYNELVMIIASALSNKGVASSALFGFIDSLFSSFNADSIRNAIFGKSFGGAYYIDDSIVTGTKDLFKIGYNAPEISTYMSGRYYSLFVVFGALISMLDYVKGVQRIALMFTAISAVLSGNCFLFMLFVLLESPWMYLFLSLTQALCYVSAHLVGLGMGYLFNGSIIEMILNADNIVYLIAGGVIFLCIGYFIARMVVIKFGITDLLNTYFPTRLNSVVKSLGGIMNIIRFKDDKLEVRNPQLVDTLSLECEIEENYVSSNDEKFVELKEYL